MSLIQAREIIWNDIIQHVNEIWDHMFVHGRGKNNGKRSENDYLFKSRQVTIECRVGKENY